MSTEPSTELMDALEQDLELAVFDVFAPRLRSLFTQELPDLLQQNWEDLSWHVDHRCKGCEFLGYPWVNRDGEVQNDATHCWPTAEREGNLSRVYGLSRGASAQLRLNQVVDVNTLAAESVDSAVFSEHQGLRAKRTALPYRAKALRSGDTSIVPDSGGDALMPRLPALHIYIFLDYDLSSAITASMAIRAFWAEQVPYRLKNQFERQTRNWLQNEVFLVDHRDLEHERREFLRFLRQLANIINDVRQQDEIDIAAGRRDTGRRTNQHERSTYQIYLWDESQRKHLIRLISRHLPHILSDPSLRELAWLFPPPELLQNASEATRKSTITLVNPVVANTVAIGIPHHYRLLDLAEKVTPEYLSPPSIHPLYEEPLSDLIPMERLHEYWNRTSNWLERQNNLIAATKAKVYALSLVVSWLENQLRDVLSRLAAPPIVPPQPAIAGIAPMSRLWLGFTKLNSAVDSLETHTTRAMPPHEREARLRSAYLVRRLEGNERQSALDMINESTNISLANTPRLLVYQLRDDSREVNIRQGDFLLALSPASNPGFLDLHPFQVTQNTSIGWVYGDTIEDAGLTSVAVTAIDRLNGLIALELGDNNCILDLEQQTSLDFSHDVLLDPVHRDFLTSKVQLTLRGIGNPPNASSNPRILDSLGLDKVRPGRSPQTPASEILWGPVQLHQNLTSRNVVDIRSQLELYFAEVGAALNVSQWAAWERALSYQLSLVWGPPGTGKSRTLRAIILGAVIGSLQRQEPLRLLVTANTYTAIDNVLLDLENELRLLFQPEEYCLYRLQSEWRESIPNSWTEDYPTLQNIVLNRADPSKEIIDLRSQLESPSKVVILGCPPQQLHNLAIAPNSTSRSNPRDTIKQWFDIIILDEASQMDVATSTLIFSKAAANNTCVLAGDDLQLPPIHQAVPPEDLDYVVGSIYNYFRRYYEIQSQSLDVNYRSNETIVAFTRSAGYSQDLRSYSPDLRLDMLTSIEEKQPDDWPQLLYWTPAWRDLIDSAYPTVSFVYTDVLSSQVNPFEADAITALIWLLKDRLANQLQNEVGPDGLTRHRSTTPYSNEAFWDRAVGVVTPHRAQMAKVVSRLRQIFPNARADQIYGAVDTVERYQGQQRDVIIASFGVGDPDIIQAEDEFLYNLNRFNVLASRARAKLIVFVTKSLLQHLSDDIDVLEESRLLKHYVESYCSDPQQISLGYLKNGQPILRPGVLRRR